MQKGLINNNFPGCVDGLSQLKLETCKGGRMRRLLMVLMMFGMVSVAEAKNEIPPAEGADSSEFAEHSSFVGTGLRYGPGFGLTVFYGRPLSDNLMLGASLFYGTISDTQGGGSLDTAQYYNDFYDLKATMLDFNGTYYFRDHGISRWGPLIRGAVGVAYLQQTAHWSRYDRDPAIIVIGDDKRLLESGTEVSQDWYSPYGRLGIDYLFLWGFKPGARVGHVLQLGIGGTYLASKKTIGYTKPNGDDWSKDSPSFLGVVEVTYLVAF